MGNDIRFSSMAKEMENHLHKVILPFWENLKDEKHGGFVSYVDSRLRPAPESVHGCILNSRILWFFSRAYRLTGEKRLLEMADWAYRELLRMIDLENGGLFWSIWPDGAPADTTKHTYNQAFAIYALSAYAEATDKTGALSQAALLFDMIEARMRDADGYLEAFTAEFKPAGNDKLSENGVEAARTMNTLLHVLEGYTELYRVGRAPTVRKKLCEILGIWEKHMWNPEKRRQEVFFDSGYRSLIDLHSYGHDIETSWLADRTLEVIADDALTSRIRPKLMEMAAEILEHAFTPDGLPAECEAGKVDGTRVWWVQAETVLGFLNAWQKTGEERFFDAAQAQWTFIRRRIVDPRRGSEWFWSVDAAGKPADKPLAEPWKCPYHNGRMIFEVMERSGYAKL